MPICSLTPQSSLGIYIASISPYIYTHEKTEVVCIRTRHFPTECLLNDNRFYCYDTQIHINTPVTTFASALDNMRVVCGMPPLSALSIDTSFDR